MTKLEREALRVAVLMNKTKKGYRSSYIRGMWQVGGQFVPLRVFEEAVQEQWKYVKAKEEEDEGRR